ncbi:type III PLP-dependent enzyme [Salipaludibacillus sp. HK11]|uniref:type III PLP-dependent enzyme n=1 Tax=Salipaludibacillus sp. HK11 TaxID=3394320 RepID=UPI0039FD3516
MEQLIEVIKQKKIDDKQPVCAFYYDIEKLRKHLHNVVNALPENCHMFYAMKANSDQHLLQVISEYVHGFEVASLGEVKKARAVHSKIPIIFGGPGKTDEEILGAMEYNVKLLHVESIHELQRVEMIASTLNKHVSILLRINLRGPLPSATLQMAGRPTQFGIDESEITNAIEMAKMCEHIHLKGFHLHSISNNLDYEKHLQLIGHYFEKIAAWNKTYHLDVSYLNAGGGIGVNYADLDNQFKWEDFTAKLPDLMGDFGSGSRKLIFECGRFLTAHCGYYAVEVLDIKENHGKHFVIVKGGTQHFRLPVSWQHNHPFDVVQITQWDYPFKRKALRSSEVTIVGQLCTPKDVFARNVYVENIRIADVIVFRYAGAYGWDISHHDFLSHPHPEHIYLRDDPVV